MFKRLSLIFLIVCLLGLLLLGVATGTDWYNRHYGMGFSDRMNIAVTLDGAPLPPSEYALAYSIGGDYRDASRTETGYSIDSDYGLYHIRVDLGEKPIGFVVENANNWWRTDISLDVALESDGTMRVVETLEIINDRDQPVETREWVQ